MNAGRSSGWNMPVSSPSTSKTSGKCALQRSSSGIRSIGSRRMWAAAACAGKGFADPTAAPAGALRPDVVGLLPNKEGSGRRQRQLRQRRELQFRHALGSMEGRPARVGLALCFMPTLFSCCRSTVDAARHS